VGVGVDTVAVFGLYMVVFLFSLSVHEAAHAWMAERFGDTTARYMGRVTLNPLVHLDLFGTIIFPAIGYFTGAPMFGWAKPVQWNPRSVRDWRKADIWISAAGPISNLIVMVGFILVFKILLGFWSAPSVIGHLTPRISSPLEALILMSRIGIQLNLVLAVFNLIPIPPLDGSHILTHFLPPRFAAMYEGLRPYGFILLLGLLYLGLFNLILVPLWGIISFLI
jgi:Zn-dependent protease